jgi:hypothetical protein
LVFLAACAQGSAQNQQVTDAPIPRDQATPIDAPILVDAPLAIDGPLAIDAPTTTDAPVSNDAAVIPDAAMADAPTTDGGPCVPVTTELLVNPAFDLTPVGTGWTEQPIQAGAPIIGNDPLTDIAPHTAPNEAWLGGFLATTTTYVNDELYQDVVVPAGTTKLVVTGRAAVYSNETTIFFAYDQAILELRRTNSSLIESVLSEDNLLAPMAWTSFTHTFAGDLSGQTVRLYFASQNDSTKVTNFYFDTLSLKATHCP